MSNRDIFDSIKRGTVAIAAMNNTQAKQPYTIFGSGFCIDTTGLVVTCRHVIEAMMEKSIARQVEGVTSQERKNRVWNLGSIKAITPFAVFFNTTASTDRLYVYPSRTADVVAKTNFDLAVLRLLPHKAFSSGYPIIEIEDYDKVHEGEEIYTCGFPLGSYLYEQLGTVTSSFTKGIISSIIPAPNVKQENLKGFQLNLTATNGNSGGPVFSLESGKVFGVLQRGVQNESGLIIQGFTKAEPIYPIIDHDLIERLKKTVPGTLPIEEDNV